MARIEHYDDPEAPEPNSLVPAASAAVSNENNEILMQHRADNDHLPAARLADVVLRGQFGPARLSRLDTRLRLRCVEHGVRPSATLAHPQ
jgi:hypothetical protein